MGRRASGVLIEEKHPGHVSEIQKLAVLLLMYATGETVQKCIFVKAREEQ